MLGERLKEFRKIKKYTIARLSEATGIPVATLSDIENGKSSPKAETLDPLFRNTELEPKWFLMGEGPMTHDHGPAATVYELHEPTLGKIAHDTDYTEVGVHDQMGAGNLAEFLNEPPTKFAWVPKTMHHSGVFYFEVVGDSMHPFVRKGAIVGIDTRNKNFLSGEIYAVWFHPEGAALKFIQSTGKTVIFYGGNREVYRDVEISTEELLDEHSGVQIIGKLKFLQQEY